MAASDAAPDRDFDLPDGTPEQERREAGDRLRERIYVTFTSLAVLVAVGSHGEHLDPVTVVWTLVVSVVGVVLAGLASDLVAHMIAHNTLPSGRELRHLVAVASRALGVLAVPVIALVLAGFGLLTPRGAMITAIASLIASLAVIVLVAVRRTRLALWKRVVVLVAIVALGVVVIFLEQLAH